MVLQTAYRLLVCIWLKQEVYSIKKDTASATQTFLVRNIYPAFFSVYGDTWSHDAEEVSSPFPLLQQSRTHSIS